jgi:hypothetical protein
MQWTAVYRPIVRLVQLSDSTHYLQPFINNSALRNQIFELIFHKFLKVAFVCVKFNKYFQLYKIIKKLTHCDTSTINRIRPFYQVLLYSPLQICEIRKNFYHLHNRLQNACTRMVTLRNSKKRNKRETTPHLSLKMILIGRNSTGSI